MSSTNKTTYYELPQFVENDIFNPLVDDNDAYEKIDTALHNIANAEADDAAEIVGIKSRLDGAEGDIDALEAQNGSDVLTTVAQTLSGAVNELKSGEDSLDSRLDVVEDDINNVSTGLKAKVSALETQNGNEALETTAQTLSGAVNELDTKVGALETQNGNETLDTVAQTLSGAVNELNDAVIILNKGYVTPEMYGAKGDGVTDDTAALQACLDEADIVFLNGTYLISDTLVIRSYQTIVGSRKGTIKATADIELIDATDKMYWKIDGVVFIKNASTSKFHLVASGRSFTISNCRFKNENGDLTNYVGGVNIVHSDELENYNARLVNNEFIYCNIEINGHTDGWINKCLIWASSHTYTPARYAIKIIAPSWSIEDNQFVGGSLGGLYVNGGGSTVPMFNIINNFFDGASILTVHSGVLLTIEDCGNSVLVSNNRFFYCYDGSIKTINVNFCEIIGNTFTANNRGGVATYEIELGAMTYGCRFNISNNLFNYYKDATHPYAIMNPHDNDGINFVNNLIQGYKTTKDAYCYCDTSGVYAEGNNIDGNIYEVLAGTSIKFGSQGNPSYDLYGIPYHSKFNYHTTLTAVYINGSDVASGGYSIIPKGTIGYVARGDNTDANKSVKAIVRHHHLA